MRKRLIIADKKLQTGDRILFLRSNGINANAVSLARAVAKKLPNGFATKMRNGKSFGEELLKKTNIYAHAIADLQKANIDIHYVTNITGHGMKKIMRARKSYTYVIEKIFQPQEEFLFIQQHTNLSDYEMYETFNMGQDYAIFLSQKDVAKAQKIIAENGFESLDAGFVKKWKKQVIITPKNLVYKGETFDLR